MSRDLAVVAIVAAYNEADVIEPVVRDLIANGVAVYLIDDGSTDDTSRLIEPLVGHGVVGIERIEPSADGADSRTFTWERLLQRKAQLAAEIDADWFIHHDADEFRESPWAGVSLQDAIRRVDLLGYNAIDFVDLDFWPTHDNFEAGTDVRVAFPWYSDAATYDRVQIRCWKKNARVDLASSGGHDARFDNRRVFPIRFISRHYPIRGQAHGERKVFKERRERFSDAERARNWHVQYEDVQPGTSFIRDPCDLRRYDGDAVRMTLALRHRGVEALEASVDESKAAVDATERALANARCETQSAREEIAHQSRQIGALNETLHARNVEVGEIHAQLGRVHIELADVRQRFDARTRENDALRDDVARHEDQVGQLRSAIAERTLAVAKTRTQAEMRERQLAAQTLELVSIRAALTDVRGRLDSFQQSWSWRVTAPARTLLRWLRGY